MSFPLGVYIHVPWCRRRCPYCDFDIHVRRTIPHRRYADAVARELARRAPLYAERELVSIYFGGGTPSLWEPDCVAAVVRAIRAALPSRIAPEVTLEANPDDLPRERLDAYREAGANRLSIGVQSFAPSQLVVLGRTHDAAQARRAVADARAAGYARLSLDLMYALPGQDPAALERDLDELCALAPDHVSIYQLTVEERTPFGASARRGSLRLPEPALQADLADAVDARLRAAGYAHYEVSSYARPGARAVHNALYWSGGEWVGLGCAAHSFRRILDGSGGGERWSTVKNVDEYLRRVEALPPGNESNVRAEEGPTLPLPPETPWTSTLAGDPLLAHHEPLAADTLAREAMWLGLRQLEDGVDRAGYAARHGADPVARFPVEVERLRAAGLLAVDGARLRLTRRGALLADEVALHFL
jgi:oxygen-independent coproporphyrinogen-3 oxidase